MPHDVAGSRPQPTRRSIDLIRKTGRSGRLSLLRVRSRRDFEFVRALTSSSFAPRMGRCDPSENQDRSYVWRSELALIGERWSRDCHSFDHSGERAISAISVCQRTSRREVPLSSSKSDENSSLEISKLVMACGVVVNRRNPCHKDGILFSADLSDHTAIHHEPKTIEGRDAVIRWRTRNDWTLQSLCLLHSADLLETVRWV